MTELHPSPGAHQCVALLCVEMPRWPPLSPSSKGYLKQESEESSFVPLIFHGMTRQDSKVEKMMATSTASGRPCSTA